VWGRKALSRVRRPRILTRNSLVQRFFVVFLLVIAVPVVVLGIAVTVGYRRFSLDLAAGRISQTLSQLTQGIDDEVRRTTLLTATLSTDARFRVAGVRFAQSRTPKQSYEASQLMEDRLASFFNYTNKIGAVALYMRGLPVFLYRNNWQLFERPMPRTGWFDTVTKVPDSTVILDDLGSYSLSARRRPVLKVAVCPSAEAFAHGFEALVVAFRFPLLDVITDYEFASSSEELILVDARERVILSSTPARMGTTLDSSLLKPAVLRREGATLLVSQAEVPSAGWTLVGVTNYSRVARDIEGFARVVRWVVLVLILLFSFYIEIFFRQVIRPILALIREMGRVQRGEWEVTVRETGVAELAQLGSSFNAMVSEIRRLTGERERQERERARLEVEALRLQINPHFLTNTLNSIRMMAAVSNAEPIRRMTSALMRVVSSSFRGEDTFAPLGEELDTLEQYLLIMRVRYGDTFEISMDVPQPVRRLLVLRMLLQPLVENSILHGLQGLDRRGEIAIVGREESPTDGAPVLVLEVRDNGHGMHGETVDAALGGAPETHRGMTSIGLYNVNRRILLNHGDGFGLDVKSVIGLYTIVRLRLPRIIAET
jgi:two-component system sensor histidine kinase YesM